MSITGKLYAIFLTPFSCLVTLSAFGQAKSSSFMSDQFRSVAWTKEDGLAEDVYDAMIRDNKGFTWFGSIGGGLCRFDGAIFKKYPPLQNNRNTVNSDRISPFTEDSLNNIWMGTDKGVSIYDIRADTFTNIPLRLDTGLSSNYSPRLFKSLCATKDKVFFYEPGGTISVFDIRTRERKRLAKLPQENAQPVDLAAYRSHFDIKSNCLWILAYSENQYGQLLQVLPDGTTRYHSWPCFRNNLKHLRHNAEDMKYDFRRNSIWINSGDGLLEFTLNDERFHNIEALNEFIHTKDYDRGVGIDIDNKGLIWFSSNTHGILIYDPRTDLVRPAFTDSALQKQAGNAACYIYCDRDGISWVSYWLKYGITEILPHDPPVKRFAANPAKKGSLSNQQISNIIPASNGELWIGTDDGLNIFDTRIGTFRVLRQSDLPGLSSNTINPVFVDSIMQKAWIGASAKGGDPNFVNLYEIDLKTRSLSQIIFRDREKVLHLASVSPYTFARYKKGLLIADELHGVFHLKENSLFADLVIPFQSNIPIGRMVLIDDQSLFLQTAGHLSNLSFENKNGQWVRTTHMLDTLKWQSLFYDIKDQTFWIDFKYELVHYTKNFRKLKTYSLDDGYNGISYHFVTDNAGHLWFTNDLGQLNRLDTAVGIITNVSEIDGYQKQMNIWITPMLKGHNGHLYIGGVDFGNTDLSGGMDEVFPEKYSSNVTGSAYLRSLNVNQKPFTLLTGLNYLEILSLKHNQNTISIETGIMDFYARGKGRIRYKLLRDGVDENWQYGPAYYTIRYEGLPPGDYKLIIQASNAGNHFNSPEKIISIIITPPFWQTWWFRALAALVIIGVIYGFVQYRSRNLKQRNIVLEQKVNERTNELVQRTNELHQSLSDLKTTQDQLIHSEKMASLGELTSGIAHEIKNPLNFINNFSELNLDLLTNVKEDQIANPDEHTLAELAQIINTLKKNSEKINHHGKRVDDIVKSMLQHSRVGNLTKEPVNINALCEESLKLAYHGFKAKEKTFHASFETNFDPGLPPVMAIPQELSRVLLNLFNNAFYAVHEKKKKLQPVSAEGSEIESFYKPLVTVGTKKLENKIMITVADNGGGIPQRIISKIFQPFFTTKPTGEGTGLGLSMSYDIITKSHGGELHVKSTDGEGTDFEIILPLS